MSAPSAPVRRPGNWIHWFDPRKREVGTWAFIVNRLSGLGLTLYLTMHLIVLSQLARGADGYNRFIAMAKNPVFLAGEFLVVAACLLHGMNGLRVILTSLGIGVGRQKQLLYVVMGIALAGCVFFAIRMFGGEA